MSDIRACHWTQLTSPLSAGQDLPLLSGAFRQPSGDPQNLQSIVECDHPTENVLMPACEVVLTCSHISNSRIITDTSVLDSYVVKHNNVALIQ